MLRRFYALHIQIKINIYPGDFMSILIITNNPLVNSTFGNEYEVIYADCSYREVLVKVRDLIFKGHKLLTHPLSGSVKPNETPYKSVIIEGQATKLNFEDTTIIENSIMTCDKFPVKYPILPPKVAEDFQIVDLALIKGALLHY